MDEEGKFDVQTTKSPSKPGVIIISVSGELDAECASAISAALGKHTRLGRRKFVLELSGTSAITSKGLKALLDALTRLKGKGCELACAGARGDVWQAIDAFGLDNVAPCYPDVKEATDAL